MANQGAKKRKEGNKKHMANLLCLIVACNVIYVLVRMLFFHSTFTWKHWVGLLVTSAAYGISYQQLANMAKPTFSDDGELLDGGFDMTTEGICGYLHDVIYITSFVQVASIISGKFWWTYTVIPAFAAYKAFGLIKGAMSLGSEGGVEDEKSRKKREKMEKKASRGKILRTKTRFSFSCLQPMVSAKSPVPAPGFGLSALLIDLAVLVSLLLALAAPHFLVKKLHIRIHLSIPRTAQAFHGVDDEVLSSIPVQAYSKDHKFLCSKYQHECCVLVRVGRRGSCLFLAKLSPCLSCLVYRYVVCCAHHLPLLSFGDHGSRVSCGACGSE